MLGVHEHDSNPLDLLYLWTYVYLCAIYRSALISGTGEVQYLRSYPIHECYRDDLSETGYQCVKRK